MKNKLNIKWLSNSPGPNQSQFFEELSKIKNIDLEVLYCSNRYKKWKGTDNKTIKYKYKFLNNLNLLSYYTQIFNANPGIIREVLYGKYDIFIIQGYFYPTAIIALGLLKRTKRKYLFWGEMINRDQTRLKNAIKNKLLYSYLRSATAIFTMGEKGKESYISVGVDKKNIYDLPYCNDLSMYFGIPYRKNVKGKKTILTVSQLIERKRVDIIIESFTKIAEKYSDWQLWIAGDGPLMQKLKNLVKPELRKRIIFKGFVPKDLQKELYINSDIFVLASKQDGWGMVVQEAMASGKPVICTKNVESGKELIKNDVGGILIEGESIYEMTNALELLVANEDIREKKAKEARKIAKNYDATIVSNNFNNILLKI